MYKNIYIKQIQNKIQNNTCIINTCVNPCKRACNHLTTLKWTHWGLNPGPSACEADVIPLHHVPLAKLTWVVFKAFYLEQRIARKANCFTFRINRSLNVNPKMIGRTICAKCEPDFGPSFWLLSSEQQASMSAASVTSFH